MKQILLLILLLWSCVNWSQSKIETINGKKFFVHVVEKNQTLYSIHKQYNVSIKTISDANESVSNGLSIGQEILIPVDLNDPNYYQNHIISKGETLYGISKKYKCTVRELKTINPELNEGGIQIGLALKVPKLKLIRDAQPKDKIVTDEFALPAKVSGQVSSDDTTVKHKVLAHETLYSVAKRYMVTADTIRKLNNIKVNQISEGDILIVPVKKVNYAISKNKIDRDLEFNTSFGGSKAIVKKRTYKIALFLPLMYSKNKAYMNKPIKAGSIRALHPVTTIASDFYHGFMIAADSLAKAGLNAELYIYDTKRDTSTIKSIFSQNDFKEIDLIVGPFFPETIDYMGRYCRREKIPMVIPFNSGNKVLYNNPYVYKTTASNMMQMDGLVDYVAKDFSNYNVVIVKPTLSSDKKLFERARNRYNSAPKMGKTFSSNIVEVSLGNSSGKEMNLKLRKDMVNVIIVPSTDVKFVTSVYQRLNNILNINTYARGMKIIVFGLEDWNNIDDIDLKHRMRMEQHYASYRFLDLNQIKLFSFLIALENDLEQIQMFLECKDLMSVIIF